MHAVAPAPAARRPPRRRRQRHGARLEALSVALPSGLLECLGGALAAPPRDWCAVGAGCAAVTADGATLALAHGSKLLVLRARAKIEGGQWSSLLQAISPPPAPLY